VFSWSPSKQKLKNWEQEIEFFVELHLPADNPRELSAVTRPTQIKWRRIESAAQLERISNCKLNHSHITGPFRSIAVCVRLCFRRVRPRSATRSILQQPPSAPRRAKRFNCPRCCETLLGNARTHSFISTLHFLPRFPCKLIGCAALIIAFQSGLNAIGPITAYSNQG